MTGNSQSVAYVFILEALYKAEGSIPCVLLMS